MTIKYFCSVHMKINRNNEMGGHPSLLIIYSTASSILELSIEIRKTKVDVNTYLFGLDLKKQYINERLHFKAFSNYIHCLS